MRKGRSRNFSPSLPGDRYLKLDSKSDLRGPKSRGNSFGTTLWGHVLRYCAQFLVFIVIYGYLILWVFCLLMVSARELNFLPTHWEKMRTCKSFYRSFYMKLIHGILVLELRMIVHLVEQCTCTAEVRVRIPVQA